MQKIIVTGATGNIGRHLVEYLKNKNIDFIATTTKKEKQKEFLEKEIESEIIDFNDIDSLKKAFKKGTKLFLLNPMNENVHKYIENAVNAAKDSGIEFILRNSGFGASTDSDIFLNKVQGIADDIVRQSGINYTIGCPNSFMQNFTVYSKDMIKNTSKMYFSHENGKVSFIDVRDIADVYTEILTNPEEHYGKTYDLTGGESLDNYEIARIFSKTLNKEIEYIPISEKQSLEALKDMNMPEWNVDALTSLDKIIKQNFASPVSGTVKNITGNDPRKFDDFVFEYGDIWR